VTDCAAVLTIDLAAVAENWRRLNARLGDADCGGVVKADAYGLGAARVGPALWDAGCRTFFVALVEEGAALRAVLPEADIHVLGGLHTGPADLVFDAALTPVLNSLNDVRLWRSLCAARGVTPAADLHIDTGMARLGLDRTETARLMRDPDLLDGVGVDIVMTHLACAETPDHPLNGEQRDLFERACGSARARRASIANSAGVFLGPDFHADIVRPGIALYGSNPTPQAPNPMAQVVRLQGKILQVRRVDPPETVGYGASHRVDETRRIATVGVGYADGYLRSISSTGSCVVDGRRVPVVGRVSMDLITIDVSGVAEARAHPGALVDLIGAEWDVDAVADSADTIGYEILTSLGARYPRVYVG
jgi:alanine racemase